MKVLLLKDVYKLGRAGDVKRVADGYGRNYLLPQGLAVLATSGAMKQAEHIRAAAAVRRQELNQEMGGVAEQLVGLVLTFPARASETGKLYGSVTPQMIADEINKKVSAEISRRQIDIEPLRTLGEHTVPIRLTVDLIPEISVIIHREGEAPVRPTPAPDLEEELPAEPEEELLAEPEGEAAGEEALEAAAE
jgi:large subunit ribosomal protein L9